LKSYAELRRVNVDIDLVRGFVTVAELKSFTRAAERLGRSQPALSLQIKRLEDRLGAPLFDRRTRALALTSDGEAMLPSARRLIRVHDEMVSKVRSEGLGGQVKLGAPEELATARLADLLAVFCKSHPQVTVTMSCAGAAALSDRFQAGELDLLLVLREPSGQPSEVGAWRQRPIWAAVEAQAICSRPVLPLCLRPPPCMFRDRAIAALEQGGRAWRIVLASESLAGIYGAMRAGLGATVLPSDMVSPDRDPIVERCDLPALADVEVALLQAKGNLPRAAALLAEEIGSRAQLAA